MTIDGRFTLKRHIGSGACGAVWLASDREARNADIVLKILHPFFDRFSFGVRQLAREAEVLAQLGHPNIAKPFAFNTGGIHSYLGMEFIDGRSLDQEIGAHTRSETHFPLAEVSRIFLELCSAVSHAHSRTIIHRDLKPQNVMIVRKEGLLFVKVLDFGIAKLLEGDALDATTFGRRLGSMFYMAPEQCLGGQAGVRSDVFALGVILFEILTLRRAWAWDPSGRPLRAFHTPVPADGANSLSSVMLRIAGAPRPRVADLRPELGASIDRAVLKAMAIDPAARFSSVDVLAAELSEVFDPGQPRDLVTELVTIRSQRPAALGAGFITRPGAGGGATRSVPVDETEVFGALSGGDPDATEMHPVVEDPDTTAPRPTVIDPDSVPDGATVTARVHQDPDRTELRRGELVPDSRTAEPASTELMFAVVEPPELSRGDGWSDDRTPAAYGAFRIVKTPPEQAVLLAHAPIAHPTATWVSLEKDPSPEPGAASQPRAVTGAKPALSRERGSRGGTIAAVVILWLVVALLALFLSWIR